MDTDKVGVEPMWGAMAEADFEANTITFDMRGDYFAAVGLYAIVPQAEYERMLRIYRAWQGAAVGECSAAGRMELDGDSVCGFFISTSADELRRNPFGQRVRLVPDQAAA